MSSVASEVDDLAAQPSEPSRDLDPARVTAILGVGVSALSAGILVLLELRRHRAHSAPQAADVVGLAPRPPADLDALVSGIREQERAVPAKPKRGDVPVWVTRLDADADADAAVDVAGDADLDGVAPFIDGEPRTVYAS